MTMVPFSAASSISALADDHIDAVVAHVERLGGALHAVAENGDDLVFQDFLGLGKGEFLAGGDVLDLVGEFDLCHDVVPLCPSALRE